mgnify:CR=1 FL=1|jgi:hypothetical protein
MIVSSQDYAQKCSFMLVNITLRLSLLKIKYTQNH